MPKKSKHLILDNSGDLLQFEAPETTNTYKALSHSALYESIRTKAHDLGFTHLRDQLEITHAGNRAFMNIQFAMDDDTMPFSVAARSTYDRSASVGIATGASVFICSNLMISGSDTTIMRQHRGTIIEDLDDMLNSAFGTGMERYNKKLLWKEELKETGLTERQGRYLLAMANLEGILNKQAHKSAEEHWIDAPFAEFRGDRTLWGLYNSMTWGSHKIRPADKLEAHKGIVDFTEQIVINDGKLVIA